MNASFSLYDYRDAREKLIGYCPPTPTRDKLLAALLGPVANRFTVIPAVVEYVDQNARRMSAMRMTATCGTGKREAPYARRPAGSAGRHYATVASFLARSRNALSAAQPEERAS